MGARLTSSVAAHGVLQPLVVTESGDGSRLVAGERRYRAFDAAGLEQIPAAEQHPRRRLW